MNTYKLTCVALLTTFLTFSPYGISASNGVIHFSGAIVDSGCSVATSQQDVSVGCYNNGKTTYTKTSVHASKIDFPSGKISKIKWIDANKKLGIITVTYS